MASNQGRTPSRSSRTRGDKSQTAIITGVKELRRQLKDIDDSLDPALKKAGREVADWLAGEAQDAASSRQEKKLAATLKGQGTVKGASISLGTGKFVHRTGKVYDLAALLGAEFGSDRSPQFKAWRGKGSGAGYFLYPTIRSNKTATAKRYAQAINKLAIERNL